MKIIGKKEFFTSDTNLDHAYVGTYCDKNHKIKGININFNHGKELISL